MAIDALNELPESTSLPAPTQIKANAEVWARDVTNRLGEDYAKIVRALQALDTALADHELLLVARTQSDPAVTAHGLATVTRKGPLVILGDTVRFLGVTWLNVGSPKMFALFFIPDDYVSGDLTFRIGRRGLATNTAVMRKDSFRFRDATALLQIDTAVNIDFTPGDTNTHILAATIAAANFQAGDVIRMDFSRLAEDVGDTMAGDVTYDGGWVEYAGRA